MGPFIVKFCLSLTDEVRDEGLFDLFAETTSHPQIRGVLRTGWLRALMKGTKQLSSAVPAGAFIGGVVEVPVVGHGENLLAAVLKVGEVLVGGASHIP